MFRAVRLYTPNCLVLFIAMSGAAQAQDATGTFDDMWSPTEVIVTGQYKGPALWKIARGDRVVWIIGVLPLSTANPQFDQKRIDTILTGAEAVYLPPSASGGVGTLLKYMSTKGLERSRTLSDVTTPTDYQRFLSLAVKYKIRPSDYAHDKAVWAGMRIRTDIYDKAGYSYYGATNIVLKLVKQHKVKVRPIANYKASSLIDSLSHVTEAAGQPCFGAILDDIDFTTRNIASLTAIWAQGNVRELKAAYSSQPPVSCLDDALAETSFKSRSGNDTVKVIEGAMGSTKRSVILLPINMLIGDTDLLDLLRSQGYVVQLPASLRP